MTIAPPLSISISIPRTSTVPVLVVELAFVAVEWLVDYVHIILSGRAGAVASHRTQGIARIM